MAFPLYRMRGLFDPPTPLSDNMKFQFPDPQDSQDTTQPNDDAEKTDRLAAAYKRIKDAPLGPAQQRYRDFLQNEAPDRANYQPNKMAKIAAILGGISAGVRQGAGAGAATADMIKDRGYDEALNDFKVKSDKYGKAADLEDKNDLNNIRILRDVLESQDRQDKTKATSAYQTGMLGYRRDQLNQPKFNFFTAPNGNRYGIKYGGNTTNPDMSNFGSVGMSDVDKENKKDTRQRAAFSHSDELVDRRAAAAKDLANTRFKNSKDLVDFKLQKPNYKAKILDDGTIAFFDEHNPDNEPINTGYNSGKLSDQQKIDLGLKAKQKLKQTPGPDTTKVVNTKVDGNTKVVTTDTKQNAPGETKQPSFDMNNKETVATFKAKAQKLGKIAFLTPDGKVIAMSPEDAKRARTEPGYKELQ